ncbi:tail fiber adhesin [Pantoea phage Phynn]|nr:tail fiber adhesin [Pantoea phage Phynn]
MTINSGWVGSSAVNETGQRWMSSAGSVVRIGTPFWMSRLVGQSKEDFKLNVAKSSPSTNITYYGYGEKGYATTSGTFGSLSGGFPGYTCRGLYDASNSNDGLILINGPNRTWTLEFTATGSRFAFAYDRVNSGNTYYRCTNPDGFRNYLSARVGQSLGIAVL